MRERNPDSVPDSTVRGQGHPVCRQGRGPPRTAVKAGVESSHVVFPVQRTLGKSITALMGVCFSINKRSDLRPQGCWGME